MELGAGREKEEYGGVNGVCGRRRRRTVRTVGTVREGQCGGGVGVIKQRNFRSATVGRAGSAKKYAFPNAARMSCSVMDIYIAYRVHTCLQCCNRHRCHPYLRDKRETSHARQLIDAVA